MGAAQPITLQFPCSAFNVWNIHTFNFTQYKPLLPASVSASLPQLPATVSRVASSPCSAC